MEAAIVAFGFAADKFFQFGWVEWFLVGVIAILWLGHAFREEWPFTPLPLWPYATVTAALCGIIVYASMSSGQADGRIESSRIRVDRVEAGVTDHDGRAAIVFNVYQSNIGALPAVGKRHNCAIRLTEKPLAPNELTQQAQDLLDDTSWSEGDRFSEIQPGAAFFNSCPPVKTAVASEILQRLRGSAAGRVYMFWATKYGDSSLGSKTERITESCHWVDWHGVQNGVVHVCGAGGRNRIFVSGE